MRNRLLSCLSEHNEVFSKLPVVADSIVTGGESLRRAIGDGKKILICGNGGSAADAQHFAAELVGRFEGERRALAAVALTTDTSILTAVGNDYGYETIFARQINALAAPGDVLIAISTSGNSRNILTAVKAGKRAGMSSIGLLGRDGGALVSHVDIPVVVPSVITSHIQEAHIFILHFWALVIDREMGCWDEKTAGKEERLEYDDRLSAR